MYYAEQKMHSMRAQRQESLRRQISISLLHFRASRGTDSLCYRLPFYECLYSKWPQKVEVMHPLEQKAGLYTAQYNNENVLLQAKIRQICLQSIIEGWGLLNLGFLGCGTNSLHAKHPPEPLITLQDLSNEGTDTNIPAHG